MRRIPILALLLLVSSTPVAADRGTTVASARGATVASAPGASCDPGPDAWQERSRWQRLARGMSRFDVLRLLGEPGKVSVYDGFERWEYPGALGARIGFDDRGRVAGWIPPAP